MDMQIQPRYIRAAILAVVMISICATSIAGLRAGRDIAKSKLVVSQASAVIQALGYFHDDQDRYPSSAEFEDGNRLGVYLAPVPLVQVASKICPGTLAYDTFDQRSFTLSYCITRQVDGQAIGVHKITERDVAVVK